MSKTGMSFCTRAEAEKNSATGEQGETEGTLRHLMKRGNLRVIYFGAARGDMSELCHRHVTPVTSHLHEDSTARDQEDGWRSDALNMDDEDPIAMINIAGPPATFSHVGNPKGSTIQLQGIKYTGPILRMLEHKKIPRVVINNDPRTYPRDQEMSYGWKHTRPVALLDQCGADVKMVVGGMEYRRKSRYAACESWAYLPTPAVAAKSRVCTVIAHAHIMDGCRQRKRDEAWYNVLGPITSWPEDLQIYGEGWDAYRDYRAEGPVFRGKVTPAKALDLFDQTMFTPCVAAAPGFYTGKPYVAVSRGCVPVLYGDGRDPYTWDPLGKFMRLDSLGRAVRPGDLWRLVDTVSYMNALHFWREKLVPEWDVLDQLLDRLVAGQPLGTDFGGYFRC